MKCTSIKLATKNGFTNEAKPKFWPETVFVTEENHQYSFPFTMRKLKRPSAPLLAVKVLNLPDNVKSFNTGSSMEKWTKKRPRLKSCSKPKLSREDEKFCYDTLDNNSLLVEDEEKEDEEEDKYEVHPDILELLEKSQCNGDEQEADDKALTTSVKQGNKKSKNKKKKKPKKTIISKPPTPQTEQIIRVDVVSMTVDDDYCNASAAAPSPMINDKGGIVNNEKILDVGEEKGDEDIIVRCRQLALKQRRRGNY